MCDYLLLQMSIDNDQSILNYGYETFQTQFIVAVFFKYIKIQAK